MWIMYEEEENTIEEKNDDNVCPQCGLRQYGKMCVNCEILIENEEKEKTKDDSDEYDWREKR
jgi:DNA-directed RNA polymerase subunit RPC12/RpoP